MTHIERQDDYPPCNGTKRGYPSRSAAKKACAKARFRWRVYFCQDCRQFHVTARDKR